MARSWRQEAFGIGYSLSPEARKFVMRCRLALPLAFALLLSALAPSDASAFCLHNDTDQRLFFTLENRGESPAQAGQALRRWSIQRAGAWLEAGAYLCCPPSLDDCRSLAGGTQPTRPVLAASEPGSRAVGTLTVTVFRNDKAVEGCSHQGMAAGTIRLQRFEEFDRCAWQRQQEALDGHSAYHKDYAPTASPLEPRGALVGIALEDRLLIGRVQPANANGTAEEVVRPFVWPGQTQARLSGGKPISGGKKITALILHDSLGFHGDPEVESLQQHLIALGIESLAVTLSLGLDGRRQPFDCAQPHGHRHTDALPEIAAWLHWLRDQGRSHIIGIGFGHGANQLAWQAWAAEQGGETMAHPDGLVLIDALRWTQDKGREAYEKRFGQPLIPLLGRAIGAIMTEPEEGTDTWFKDVGFLGCTKAKVNAASLFSYYNDDDRLDTSFLVQRVQVPILEEATTEARDPQALARAIHDFSHPLANRAKP